MGRVRPGRRELRRVAIAAVATALTGSAQAGTTYVDCNTHGLDSGTVPDHVLSSRTGNSGGGNGGESIDILVDVLSPSQDVTVTCIRTADEQTGGHLFVQFGGGPPLDLGPYWPEIDPGVSRETATASASAAVADARQVLREFTFESSGGINVGSIDPATGDIDVYSVTLQTTNTDSTTVWFNRVHYSDATGWQELSAGVARGVAPTKASVNRGGIQIDISPGDWSEIWIGQGIAALVRGWDAHAFESTEHGGPRIYTTPCSRRIANGERWEKALHAAGVIDGFSFDSSAYAYPDLPPYWYFTANGEKGRVQEIREPDCPYSGE